MTAHSELVARQRAAVAARKDKEKVKAANAVAAPKKDDEWSGEGDDFVRQSDAMVAK